MLRLFAVLFALTGPAGAQDGTTVEDIEESDRRAGRTLGAELRGLDKVSGDVTSITIAAGEQVALGRLRITLEECRYPADNRAGEAFAYLRIESEGREAPFFAGWMIASSPALNALDHPRYDVWVIRCTTV